MALKHTNNGRCAKCHEIMDRYPGFYPPLRAWFVEAQAADPELHCSEAGRGKARQEECFKNKTSNAHYGESAHNYNAALDLFENGGDPKNIYEEKWFKQRLAPRLIDSIEWYGRPGSKFRELPHIELKGWEKLVEQGVLSLVEKDQDDAA